MIAYDLFDKPYSLNAEAISKLIDLALDALPKENKDDIDLTWCNVWDRLPGDARSKVRNARYELTVSRNLIEQHRHKKRSVK